MLNFFFKTIIQYGGNNTLTNDDKITILNQICKAINVKIKKYNEHYEINIDLKDLPLNNWDCSPTSIPIQSVAVVDGPVKGVIPYYTNVEIDFAVPEIVPTITPVPLSPRGPIIGVPGIGVGINPFGSSSNSFKNKLNKCKKYIDILKQISTDLEDVIAGKKNINNICKDYFKFNNNSVTNEEFVKKMQAKQTLRISCDTDINNILNKNI